MRWSGLRLSVTLLTVIPLRDPVREPGRAAAAAAMAWAPAVGLLLGVVAAAVLVVADHPLGAGSLTAAGLAVATLALLTRGLHLDGLADLTDGLGSGRPAPVALDIMRRSDIGPFGTVTLILTLLIQVAAVSHAETSGPGRGAAALITAVVTGRLALTWACRRGVPAARPDGLGALVAGTVRPVIPVALTLAAVAAAAGAVVISATLTDEPLGWTLPLAIVAGLAAAFVLLRQSTRRLGGITGDVLGALAEVATTVAVVVATMGPRALPCRGHYRPEPRALPARAAGITGPSRGHYRPEPVTAGNGRRYAGRRPLAPRRRHPPSAAAPGTSSLSGRRP
jgi:adenosylcobinamide-GDP ribazoletransferase